MVVWNPRLPSCFVLLLIIVLNLSVTCGKVNQNSPDCSKNCQTCKSPTECTQCEPLYFPKTTSNGTFCEVCGTGCELCVEKYSCFRCVRGYSLEDSTSSCKPCADIMCAVCSGDQKTCKECVPGYSINSSGKCTPDTTHLIAMGLLIGLIIAGGCLLVLLVKWICFPSIESTSHPRGATPWRLS